MPADSRVWSECLSLRRAGWDVTVISRKRKSRDTSAFESLEGVQIHRFDVAEATAGPLGHLPEYGSALARISVLVRRLSRRTFFDVVQACNPPDFLLLTAIQLRRRGSAMVFDQHDLSPELYAVKYGKRFGLQRTIRLAERVGFALADATLAMNESFREVAITRGGQVPEDIFVVRNAPDVETFRPVEADARLKAGAAHLIGYVGEMNSQDGLDLALEALATLHRRYRRDWHAIFVGDGEVLPDAREMVLRLGIGDHVTFTGFVTDRPRLARIISSCDLCISPEPRNSLNEKSTLVKVAEYMAVGRPVVAFDLLETRRTAGDAAVYAARDDPDSFAEAIHSLLGDQARRERMGALGRERVLEEFNWGRSEEALLAAYDHSLRRAALRARR